jgi:hypothetical protein
LPKTEFCASVSTAIPQKIKMMRINRRIIFLSFFS